MNRATKKQNVPEITTTYVWRVELSYMTSSPSLELVVICTEQIPGEKFAKAVEDTFSVYSLQGKIDDVLPSDFSLYTVKTMTCIGLAAGCAEIMNFSGVSIGKSSNGMPMMVDPSRLAKLAGLAHDKSEEKKADISQLKRENDEKLRENEKKELASLPVPIFDAMMETAAHMAAEGDFGAADGEKLLQAVHVINAINPSVFRPSPPVTPEERIRAIVEMRKAMKVPEPLFSEKECADFSTIGIAVNPQTGEFKMINKMYVLETDIETEEK